MRRGFTLIELMIGTLVGAFTVLVAAHVATVVVNQAAKGRQATDFNARARLVGRQIRNDIRLTGVGTTGAVTADPANALWGAVFAAQTAGGVTPGGGYTAFPTMIGVNADAGTGVGGTSILAGSDVVMMVVANPSAQIRTFAIADAGQSTLVHNDLSPTAAPANFVGCDHVLIVDHSTPSGAGRSQIASLNSVAAGAVTINDALQFSVQPQSEIMCARVSTYWVSDPDGDGVGNYLHRSDLRGVGPLTTVGGVVIESDGASDIIAPGIIDLQIAYAFSAEIYRPGNPPNPYTIAAAWAYGATPGAEAQINTSFDWFEVRQARFTIHAKRMRAIDNFSALGSGVNVPRAEDGGAFPIDLPRSVVPETLTSAETLINLRYFDFGLPAGVAAEPY
jgi:prepilin-type N-terminal cleavage/methylation domain-containing protein